MGNCFRGERLGVDLRVASLRHAGVEWMWEESVLAGVRYAGEDITR
jgi:hypothetical protein